MFLTRVKIDSASRSARKFLSSQQMMHAIVRKASTRGEAPERDETSRILWRIDNIAGKHTMFIVSPEEPDFTILTSEFGGESSGDSVDYIPFLHQLEVGQRWSFRLTANPTRSESRGTGKRGKRYGHVTASQQMQWLSDRSAKFGFSVASDAGVGTDPALNEQEFQLVGREKPRFDRRSNEGRDQITINRVTYEGVLAVTDTPLLRRALGFGIGPSKAYGCGLLTLAPVRASS